MNMKFNYSSVITAIVLAASAGHAQAAVQDLVFGSSTFFLDDVTVTASPNLLFSWEQESYTLEATTLGSPDQHTVSGRDSGVFALSEHGSSSALATSSGSANATFNDMGQAQSHMRSTWDYSIGGTGAGSVKVDVDYFLNTTIESDAAAGTTVHNLVEMVIADMGLSDNFSTTMSDVSGLGVDKNDFGTLSLIFSATAGDAGEMNLHAMSNVAAVPLPAAAWLLGGGLMALAGLARRNSLKKM